MSRDGKVVPLSAREFQLLRYFVEHRGTTLSRDVLLKEVWAYSTEAFTRTVDVHVASLRQKLEEDPKQPTLIVTVARLGYKFAPESTSIERYRGPEILFHRPVVQARSRKFRGTRVARPVMSSLDLATARQRVLLRVSNTDGPWLPPDRCWQR